MHNSEHQMVGISMLHTQQLYDIQNTHQTDNIPYTFPESWTIDGK